MGGKPVTGTRLQLSAEWQNMPLGTMEPVRVKEFELYMDRKCESMELEDRNNFNIDQLLAVY